MHYFARGAVASHAHFRIVRVTEAAHIEGTLIRSGDVLHGDENGLLVVPTCDVGALRHNVETVRSSERALLDYIRSESFTLAGLRERFLH
jgi:regulator of RNase E activity RraA